MTAKTLSVHESVEQNLDNLLDEKVIELMRWKYPVYIERMGAIYKKYVDKTETEESLKLGYIIKTYLTNRIGEPK